LASKWTFEALLARQTTADRERVVTGVHLGGMRLVARELQISPEDRRESILQKIQLQFRAPLELRPLSELNTTQRQRLSEPFGYIYQLNSDNEERLRIAFESSQYLQLGPFTDYSTIAFEDALWGWLRLLVYQVERGEKSAEGLESLSRGFGLPVRIDSPEDLPQAALDRIRSGRDVAFYSDQGTYYATTKLAQSDEYLRVGPLPEFQDVAKPASQTTLTSAFLASGLLTGLLVIRFLPSFAGSKMSLDRLREEISVPGSMKARLGKLGNSRKP
jgi:hypothetical protein